MRLPALSLLLSPLLSLLLPLLLAAPALALPAGPYDETADAPAQVRATLAEAQRAGLPVLVVFGANWCGDCRALDLAFHEGRTAALIAQRYRVVKVDVGRFDRNTALAETYGVPLKKGIPAVAVLASDGRLRYATTGGELADARRMGDAGIYAFFSKLAAN